MTHHGHSVCTPRNTKKVLAHASVEGTDRHNMVAFQFSVVHTIVVTVTPTQSLLSSQLTFVHSVANISIQVLYSLHHQFNQNNRSHKCSADKLIVIHFVQFNIVEVQC